ncbi:uncharacterized protein LOC120329404 [Styela clava]
MATLRWFLPLLQVAILFVGTRGDDAPAEGADSNDKGNETVGGRSFVPHFHAASACSNVVCMNGGTCYSTGSNQPNTARYQCRCILPFHGTHCEHGQRSIVIPSTNHCYPNPCMNGGSCYTSGKGYTCRCAGSWSGTHCETPLYVNPVVVRNTPCTQGFNPCNNMCECVNSCRHSSGYYCRSANGYLGKNCTIPPPNIQCLANQIIVTVDDAFVREYDLGIGNSRLYLGRNGGGVVGQDCYAITSNGISHTFTIPLPFGKCGTSVQAIGGKTVANNVIWLNRFTNAAYDMPVPVINFECTYTKEYIIVTSLQPAIDQPPTLRETGFTRVRGTIELCKVSSSCPNTCPTNFAVREAAVYTIGEMIHLNIRGDQSIQGIVALKTLYLSCDASPSNAIVRLVTNGCPGGSQNYMPTRVTYSGRSSSVCASFQVPRLQGCPVFYIHAELETCIPSVGCTYNPSTCGQQIMPGRRRRDLNETEHKVTNVFGPIYVLSGERGVPYETLFPNTTIVSSPAQFLEPKPASEIVQDSTSLLLIVGLSLLCFLVILSISGLIVYRSRYSK